MSASDERNVIISAEKDIFKKDPSRIIEAFYAFSKAGKNFSHELRKEIKHSLLLIGRKVRSSHRATLLFLEILKGKRVYETLREMNETGVLGRFILDYLERIYEDYKLSCSVLDNNLAVSIVEKHDSTTEITIGAWDSPGLFSKI